MSELPLGLSIALLVIAVLLLTAAVYSHFRLQYDPNRSARIVELLEPQYFRRQDKMSFEDWCYYYRHKGDIDATRELYKD